MKTPEIIARAIIIKEGKILLCKSKRRGYYFLPGGHVEFGEKIEEALIRELKEELNAKTVRMKLVGLVQNRFREENKNWHEINFIFETKLKDCDISSREDRILFEWVELSSLKKTNILPAALPALVVKWLKNKQIFSDISVAKR